MRCSSVILTNLVLCAATGLAQTPAAQPELTGTLSWNASPTNIQSVLVQVGDGGSGPYKSVLVGDPSLKTHTIYRPRDLKPFGAALKMPVVAYGNGACRNSSYEVRNFLTEIASHGFLVVAIGPAIASVAGGVMVNGPTKSDLMLNAITWAIAENARTGSEYFGKLDPEKFAVMGQSCGGLQAMEVSSDPRVATTVMLNTGILPEAMRAKAHPGMPAVSKEQLTRLHAPIIYINGGKIDIAYANGADDFSRIDKVPAVMVNREVGHYPATYQEPRGGAFGEAASAWLKWQLKADQTAATMFKGPNCGLCLNPKWTVEKKRID